MNSDDHIDCQQIFTNESEKITNHRHLASDGIPKLCTRLRVQEPS